MGRVSTASAWGIADRRSTSSTMLLGFSEDSDVSMRNRSAQATSGRNTKKLVPTTRMTMVTMAMVTLVYEPEAAAAPM